MTSGATHYSEELQEFLDKRLNANVRRAVEAHLETCADCRREMDAIAWAQQVVRLLPTSPAPEGLGRKVLSAIRTERIDVERLSQRHKPVGFKVPLFVAFLVLAGLVGYLVLQIRGKAPQLTTAELMARDFSEFRNGHMELAMRTGSPAVLETYFSQRDVPFPMPVYSPEATGLQLVGGNALEPEAEMRAFVVYRGPAGETLVSQAANGSVDDMPPGAIIHEHRGIRFHSFYANGATAVCWQEGPVVRSIASDMPLNRILEIASSQAGP